MRLLFATPATSLAAATAIATASPVYSPLPLQQSLTTEPCARVSASSASYLAATPTGILFLLSPASESPMRLSNVLTKTQPASAAIVDGALFHECLQSIPLNQSAALDLVHSLEPYVELQTTLDYLADPPHNWPHPPVDIKARLQTLVDDVTCGNGNYTTEYDFQAALYRIFLSARDGHFSFIPDLFDVAAFKIPGVSLVSISPDGNAPPHVYFQSDIVEHTVTDDGFPALTLIGNEEDPAYYAPSPIISINGIDTAAYLSAGLDELPIPFHDADAAYNFLFFEIAQTVQFGDQAGQGAFPNPIFYPGPETVFGLANGSTTSIRTVAEIHAHADFDGVKDGISAYRKFCVRDKPVSRMEGVSSPSPSLPTSTAQIADMELRRDSPQATPNLIPLAFPLYPSLPTVMDEAGRVAGYHLNDTAVLVILDFAVQDESEDDPSDFQDTIARFLELCKEKGQKRLIIDLFANGGGTLELGIDTAVQIFPAIEPAVYGNMRASEVLDDLGRRGNSRFDDDYQPASRGLFDVRSLLNADGQDWTDWHELFEQPGFLPLYNERDKNERQYIQERNHTHIHEHEHEHEHGNFDSEFECESASNPERQSNLKLLTQTFQFNLTATSPPGLHMHMARKADNGLARPESVREPVAVFAPENVVLVTDGYCASTCAVFVELLTTMTTARREQQQQHVRDGHGHGHTRGRVRTLAVGGRSRRQPKGHDDDKMEMEMEMEKLLGEQMQDRMQIQSKMQIVGATKGAAFWSFGEILNGAENAMRYRGQIANAKQNFTDLPLRRTMSPGAAGVNGVNHIRSPLALSTVAPDRLHGLHSPQRRQGDGGDGDEQAQEEEEEEEDEEPETKAKVKVKVKAKIKEEGSVPAHLPLQFTRKDADFHLFHTRETLVRKDVLWKRVRDVVFGDNS